MLTEVDLSLLAGAVFVALVSWRNPRGIMWICVAALSYINATVAWRLSFPYAEAITGMGDAGVCLAIYIWGKERWEMIVWRLFQTSVAVSMLYLAGNLHVFFQIPHEVYSILLELANWILLLLVGGISAMQWAGVNVGARGPWNRVRDFALSLHRERKTPVFYKVQ